MTQSIIQCSFCAASSRQARRLIAGPHIFVCDKCVLVMMTILGKQDRDWFEEAVAEVRASLSNAEVAVAH